MPPCVSAANLLIEQPGSRKTTSNLGRAPRMSSNVTAWPLASAITTFGTRTGRLHHSTPPVTRSKSAPAAPNPM